MLPLRGKWPENTRGQQSDLQLPEALFLIAGEENDVFLGNVNILFWVFFGGTG
jgi:hypothetical protein